ncbi:kyphoscoliosis peptidase-like [Branchiostoma floridae x Branchiostoma belcheri]
MGCSCSKSNRVDVVEERRPVRKLSGKDDRQPTPTSTQGPQRTDGKGPLKDGVEQNRPNEESLKDVSVADIKQNSGEEGSKVRVEASVHEEPKETAAVEQKKDQTSPNNQHSKGTVAELQGRSVEQSDQGNVQKYSTVRSAENDERAGTTAAQRKTQEPRRKKDLIPDIQVFKDLDERAVQAPEGHASIKDLVLYLIQTAKTPLEKARVLFRWVTSHIQYDVVSYVTGGSKDVTPGGVFKKRMSVCQGYSELYKEMCSLAEVECVTISGRSKGGSYRVGDKFGPGSDHAWNAVKIDGRWYLIDSTWAAGNTDLQKRAFEFKYNEHYFFTDPEVFVMDHHPMDNKWQLLEEPVLLEVFENQVALKSPFFTLGLLPQSLSHTKCPVRTQNGEATISIKIPEPMAFTYKLYPYEGGYTQNENVLYEIVNNVAMFTVVPAQKGRFLFQLYGKRGTANGQHNEICSYMVDSDGPKSDHLPFPRLETSTWGPGPWLLDKFISDISHSKAIITLNEGDTKITFQASRPLHYKCALKEDVVDENKYRIWDSHAFFEVNSRAVTVYTRAPKTGQFILTIWAKEEHDQMYHKCIHYLLKSNKCKAGVSPYPTTFSNWTNGCRLYEPLDGRLAANQRVHFRVACPNAVEVVVIATQWRRLVRKADGSWEGDADTGEQGRVLKVATKMPGGTSYSTLLQYEVVA